MDLESEPYPKRRLDAMTGLILLVTFIGLAGAAWMRFGPATASVDATVGGETPLLGLIDAETTEPIVLVGLNSKVAWVVFFSAEAPSGRSCLTEVEAASKPLLSHRKFAMIAAAVEVDRPAKARAAAQEAGFRSPVYLADAETRRRFGVESADPPLHVLIDAGGRILAMARGDSRPTIGRVAELARDRLDEIDPLGEARFALSALRPR